MKLSGKRRAMLRSGAAQPAMFHGQPIVMVDPKDLLPLIEADEMLDEIAELLEREAGSGMSMTRLIDLIEEVLHG